MDGAEPPGEGLSDASPAPDKSWSVHDGGFFSQHVLAGIGRAPLEKVLLSKASQPQPRGTQSSRQEALVFPPRTSEPAPSSRRRSKAPMGTAATTLRGWRLLGGGNNISKRLVGWFSRDEAPADRRIAAPHHSNNEDEPAKKIPGGASFDELDRATSSSIGGDDGDAPRGGGPGPAVADSFAPKSVRDESPKPKPRNLSLVSKLQLLPSSMFTRRPSSALANGCRADETADEDHDDDHDDDYAESSEKSTSRSSASPPDTPLMQPHCGQTTPVVATGLDAAEAEALALEGAIDGIDGALSPEGDKLTKKKRRGKRGKRGKRNRESDLFPWAYDVGFNDVTVTAADK